MKRVSITIEEVVKYTDEVIVVQPDNMSDNDFDKLLNRAERTCKRTGGSASDFAIILEELGLEVAEYSTSFPDCPSDVEFEILDVISIK